MVVGFQNSENRNAIALVACKTFACFVCKVQFYAPDLNRIHIVASYVDVDDRSGAVDRRMLLIFDAVTH